MQKAIRAQRDLAVLEAGVEGLILRHSRVEGVVLEGGEAIASGAAVLTTGTFLRGVIYIGERQIPAGRAGERPALGMCKVLEAQRFTMGRLKTGTPARLDGPRISWAALDVRRGDQPP